MPVKCEKCHETNRFQDAPEDCYGCHKKEDEHKLKFGEKCDSCHNTRGWPIWDFNHDKRTEYKIEGAHLPIDKPDMEVWLRREPVVTTRSGRFCSIP